VTGIDNWEYAKWVTAVGRSLRLNPATGAELTAAQTFISQIIAVRDWLTDKCYQLQQPGSNLNGDDYEGRIIEEIGRNMMKIEIQDATEKGYCDALFTATSNRKYGDMSNMATADVDNSGS
jgi:hypothetical protein